jgi:poly-gamma-glutamate synthesis protein (capsule biosynthesis protein)
MKTLITIGGDFCITPEYFTKRFISEDLSIFLSQSDLNIVNLECPVLNDKEWKSKRIVKTGPHLYTTEEIFNQLKTFNVNLVTLANNHILDYGEEGLYNTIEGCKTNNIEYVGAGSNIKNASNPKIVEINGLRIGIVNFCEKEWSIATKYRAGANPFDLIENLRQIKYARENADFVFVIIHGGHEYYSLPSKRMIKTYRFIAEQGVDAVIGHHTHCVSGFEVHKNVPVFYSLGNMLFTNKVNNEKWYSGLLLRLELEKGYKVTFKLIPVQQSKQDFKLTLLKDELKKQVLDTVANLSETIGNEIELENQWDLFLEQRKKVINIFSPISIIPGRYLRAVLYRLGLNKLLMKNLYLSQIFNHIRCEAHYDLVNALLEGKIEKKSIQKCSR